MEAGTVVFRQTTWQLKDVPQSAMLSSHMERQAMALSEAERLKAMDRFDDYTQLWCVSLNRYSRADASWKRLLRPVQQPNRYYRELAFLGTGRGQAWYAFMPIYHWTQLQADLGLADGEDPLAAAVRGVVVDDPGSMTRNSAEAMLTTGGATALPYNRQLLASTNFSSGLRALGWMNGKEPAALLIDTSRSPNPAIATGARHMLESYPRPEAERLYLGWLAQDAGKRPVAALLEACAKTAPGKLGPYLPRILESPKTVQEFRRAFEFSRTAAGRPIPERLLKLEGDIKQFGYASSTNYSQTKVDQAVREVLTSGDPEAAAVLAISLATATTKGDWRAANRAGITIIRNLPGGYGQKVARRVVNSLADDWLKEHLRQGLSAD